MFPRSFSTWTALVFGAIVPLLLGSPSLGSADRADSETLDAIVTPVVPELVEMELPEPEPSAEEAAAGLETPVPERWRTSRGRQCRRRNGRVVCDGPRRVPEPFGEAAERAAELGLDEETRAGRLAMYGAPPSEWSEAIADGAMGEGMLWPVVEGRLWRGFGPYPEFVRRRGGGVTRGARRRLHRGVDIGAAEGSLIRAVNDALVVYSFNGMSGYGNALVLLHPDDTITLYAHCRATYVFAGQRVRRGQTIAEVGHTGLAHGDHLHFEWRQSGRPRNPGRLWVEVPQRPERPGQRTP